MPKYYPTIQPIQVTRSNARRLRAEHSCHFPVGYVSLCSTCRGQTDHRNFQKDGPPREWTRTWELKSSTVCFWVALFFFFFFSAWPPLDWAFPALPNGQPIHRWPWRGKSGRLGSGLAGPPSLTSTCKYVPKVSVPAVLFVDFCKWLYRVLLTLLLPMTPPSSTAPPPPYIFPPSLSARGTSLCPVFSLSTCQAGQGGGWVR